MQAKAPDDGHVGGSSAVHRGGPPTDGRAEQAKAQASDLQARLALSTWAKEKALQHAKALNLGKSGAAPNMQCLAMKLLGVAKSSGGLGQCKHAAAGSVPIRFDTLEYFASLGIYINEVYGMSESAGAVTLSSDRAHAWGSCGWQFPGSDVEISKVDPLYIVEHLPLKQD